MNRSRVAGLAVLLLVLGACSSTPPERTQRAPQPGSSLPPDAVPREEPRSRYGNGPDYEVFGQRYRVMESSYGYVERGVASWYGKKFHGRLTSSREPYDMYAMTAAHKSLPLPTYAEVRNLQNGRSVIVRVNDRGPFVKNRLIDLSYAAATKLGIVRDGTGMVEVRAISFDLPPALPAPSVADAEAEVDSTAAPRGLPKELPIAKPDGAAGQAPEQAEPDGTDAAVYVQVGAFGDADNAARRHRILADNGIAQAFVDRDGGRDPVIYRVRIGPLANVDHYDRLVARLARIGISDTHLVTE